MPEQPSKLPERRRRTSGAPDARKFGLPFSRQKNALGHRVAVSVRPFYPSGNILFDYAQAERCTFFGTSAPTPRRDTCPPRSCKSPTYRAPGAARSSSPCATSSMAARSRTAKPLPTPRRSSSTRTVRSCEYSSPMTTSNSPRSVVASSTYYEGEVTGRQTFVAAIGSPAPSPLDLHYANRSPSCAFNDGELFRSTSATTKHFKQD
jgi:hypothetical protein